MKLDEFKLETHRDREVLLWAMQMLKENPLYAEYRADIDAVLSRLYKVECQLGGCSYCNPDENDYWPGDENETP